MIRVMHVISSIEVLDFFQGLAASHDRRTVSLEVCTLDGPGHLQRVLAELGVPGHALGCSNRALYPLAAIRLARLLRQRRIDVVHTHLFDPSIVGQVAALVARTPARVMTRWYSDLHETLGRPVHARIDGSTAALAHAVVAISRHTREVLISEGVPAGRIRVVYPGVAEPPAPRRTDAPGGGCRLGAVARLAPVKDHHTLLLAFQRVLTARPDTRLMVVGEGPLEPDLRALASHLGIEKAVEFAGFRRDMERVWDTIDVLVHPAIEEAFGFVLIEAMLRGIPVVCTPRGIAREIVEDATSGFLVPVGEPAALAAAMLRLAESPDLRRRIGEGGRAATLGRFSYRDVAAEYERIYADVLSR